MLNSLYHSEFGGGYSNRRKIIINAAKIPSTDSRIEVMALHEDGEELSTLIVGSEQEAIRAFNELVYRYAEPLQKSFFSAGLIPGEKYTLYYLGEFGFPITKKITFHSFQFCTYAQHSDVVKMIYKPFRKRSYYEQTFFNSSLLIFKGWQDVPETLDKIVVRSDNNVKITRSKYACFSSSYIEDALQYFKDPVLIYKNYKTGSNGKLYA